eukprot:TRINITY_DN109893_c0_g1_i1.p1 TRINITY_DN109893_c0_g1~~TRINITY_DN109893_c0_g1_i1.p1  ORF type:complete len:206 (-),score=8.33 TRINITY_DN109893_c0_g1_i1:198-779(-)
MGGKFFPLDLPGLRKVLEVESLPYGFSWENLTPRVGAGYPESPILNMYVENQSNGHKGRRRSVTLIPNGSLETQWTATQLDNMFSTSADTLLTKVASRYKFKEPLPERRLVRATSDTCPATVSFAFQVKGTVVLTQQSSASSTQSSSIGKVYATRRSSKPFEEIPRMKFRLANNNPATGVRVYRKLSLDTDTH